MEDDREDFITSLNEQKCWPEPGYRQKEWAGGDGQIILFMVKFLKYF